MFYQGSMASSIDRTGFQVGQEVQQIYAAYTGKITEITEGKFEKYFKIQVADGNIYHANEREIRNINWK